MDLEAQAREERRERLAKIRQLSSGAQIAAAGGATTTPDLASISRPKAAVVSSTPPSSAVASSALQIASAIPRSPIGASIDAENAARLSIVYEAFRTWNILINESYVALQLELHTEKLSREHRKQLTTLTFQLKVTKPLEMKNVLHRLSEQREKNRQLEIELDSLRRARATNSDESSKQQQPHVVDDSTMRQLEDVLQQLESANHEITVLQAELREARDDGQRAEERRAEAERSNNALRAAHAELSQKLDERAAQRDSTQLLESQAKTIAQMTNKIESLQKQVRMMEQAQITSTISSQNKVHDEELRSQQLTTALEAAQRETRNAEAKLVDMQGRCEAAEARYAMLAESKRDLDHAHALLVRKLDELASKEATESQLLGSTQARRLELSEALAQMTEELERERSSGKIIAAELFSLKESLKWCEDSNADLHSKLVASEERFRTASKALHAERARVAQLESEARDAQDALSADASHHQTALKKSLVQKAALQNEVAALNARLAEAQADLRGLQEQNILLADQHKAKEAELKLQLDLSEQQLAISRKESASLQDLIREQQKQYSVERSELLMQSQRDAKEYAASLLRHDMELKELLSKQQERFEVKGDQLVAVTKALDAAQLTLQKKEHELARFQREKEAETTMQKETIEELTMQRNQLAQRIGELEELQKSVESNRARDLAQTGAIASETQGKVAEVAARCRSLEQEIVLLRSELAHKDTLVEEKVQMVERERGEHAITKKLHAEDIARLRAEHADDLRAEKALRERTEEQVRISESALREALMKNSDIMIDMQRMAHEAELRQKDLVETQRLLDSSKALVKSQVGQISELIERSDGIVLSMNEEMSELKLQIATKNVEIAKLQDLNKSRSDRLVGHLQQEVEEVKSALVMQEQHHAQELERWKLAASAKEQDLQAVVDTLKDRVSSLGQQQIQKSEQMRALQDALQRCEAELSEMAIQIEAAEATAARERQNCDALEVDLDRMSRREHELLEKIDTKDRQIRETAAALKALDFDFQRAKEQLAAQQQEHAASVDALQLKLDHAQALFGSRLSNAVDSSYRRVNASFELFHELVGELEELSRRSIEDSRFAFEAAVRHALNVASYFTLNVNRFTANELQLTQQVAELTKQKKSIRMVSSQITTSLLLQIECADTHGELSLNQALTHRQDILLLHKSLCQRAAFLDAELSAAHARRSTTEFELLKAQETLTITQQQLLQAEMELVEQKRDGNVLATLAKDTAHRSTEAEQSLKRMTEEVVFFRQAVPALVSEAFTAIIELEHATRSIYTQTFFGVISDAHIAFSRVFIFSSGEQSMNRQQADHLRASAVQAINEHSAAAQYERDRCAKEVHVLKCVNQLQSAALVEGRERGAIMEAEHDAFALQLLPTWFAELLHLLKYGHTQDTQRVLHALHVSQKETQLLRSKAAFLADLEAAAFRSSVERLSRRRAQDRQFLLGSFVDAQGQSQQQLSSALDAVLDLEQAARTTLAKMALDALHGVYVFTLVARPTSSRKA